MAPEMGFSLLSSPAEIWMVILFMVAFSLWVQKFKVFKYVGPALTVIIMGMILVNTHVVPAFSEVYPVVMEYCIPIMMSIYLMDVSIPQLLKLSGKPLVALLLAFFSVGIVAIGLGAMLGGDFFEGWKLAGMMVGSYTGGSSNMAAIAVGLEATQDTVGAAVAADNIIGMPMIIMLFMAPLLFENVKFMKKVWPYRLPDDVRVGMDAEHAEEESKKGIDIKHVAWMLTIAMAIVAFSAKVSAIVFPPSFATPGRILMISTLSIIVAQIPAVKKLHGHTDVGIFFGLMYLSVIGFMINLAMFFGSAASMMLFCIGVVVGSVVLHLILCRLAKIPYEYVILGMTGSLADGTAASMVASSAKWNALIKVGLIMGIIGNVCGNYIGIGVAYIIKAIVGA